MVGDGDELSLGQLATCARHRPKSPKILVLRNEAARLGPLGPDGVRRQPEYGCDLEPVDFAAWRAIGAAGLHPRPTRGMRRGDRQRHVDPGPVLIEAIIDANEPPMPPKASLQRSAHMAEALTPVRRRMALTVNSDTVRQVT